jgi:hypothetical protein
MKLLLDEHRKQMLANGRINADLAAQDKEPSDFMPVVKLFCPWNAATWLLTELDPNDPDIAFGLCDLGMGFPELGAVSLSELEDVSWPNALRIERDLHFTASKTLSAYAEEAHRHQRIVA